MIWKHNYNMALDQHQYQKKVLSLLDVIGSTIVNIFYNHMYDRAIFMKDRTGEAITDCYKQAITEYVKTSNTQEFYKLIMNTIVYYTHISTVYSDISFADCINLYSGLFVPDVYNNSLTEKQKHDVLFMVLRNSIKVFSENLIEHHLALIIDEHQDPTNLAVLQDCILKELVKNRDLIYNQFIQSSKQKKSSKSTKKPPSKKNPVKRLASNQTQKTLLKISNLYKKAVEDRTTLKNKYADLQHKYTSLSDKTKQLQDTCIQQMKILKEIIANQKKETLLNSHTSATTNAAIGATTNATTSATTNVATGVTTRVSLYDSMNKLGEEEEEEETKEDRPNRYDELVSSMKDTSISSKQASNDEYDDLFNVQYE